MDRVELQKECEQRFLCTDAFRELYAAIGRVCDVLSKCAEDIGDAIKELVMPAARVVCDAIAIICEVIDNDDPAQTVPPRNIVRRIGCRPHTKSRAWPVRMARKGCRHK